MPTINQLASKRVRLVKRHKTKSGALKKNPFKFLPYSTLNSLFHLINIVIDIVETQPSSPRGDATTNHYHDLSPIVPHMILLPPLT